MPDRSALDNLTVLVTRPAHQADGLIKQLQGHGARVLHQPAISIHEAASASLAKPLNDYQWLIFISKNAVDYGLKQLSIRSDSNYKLAAIGKATQSALTEHGFDKVFSPAQGFTSEDLLATSEFSENQVRHQNILIIRGGEGRQHLKQQLEARHAGVDYLDVYHREIAKRIISPAQLAQSDIITISSQQGLENLITMFEPEEIESIFNKLLIVPGERCHQKATELGFNRVETAANATDSAMLNCIIENINTNIISQ